MNSKQPHEPEVIEAVLIDDDGHPVDENTFERVTREGAEFIDAVADTAKFIDDETAAELHEHANTVRDVREKVSTATTAGKKFLGGLAEAADKLGIRDRFTMVRREHGRASSPDRGE